jgi:hypothetical protein
MNAEAQLLVDLGNTLFVPAAPAPCDRWESYVRCLLLDNQRVWTKYEELGFGPEGELKLLDLLSRGQRIAWILWEFDAQTRNGGIAQFLYNKGHLAEEALAAFDILGLHELQDLFASVLTRSDQHPTLLQEARRIGEEEAGKSSDGSRTQRAHKAYERMRVNIEAQAKRIEDQYFPTFEWLEQEKRSQMHYGQLRVAMCVALNEYIAAHPGEFQVLLRN